MQENKSKIAGILSLVSGSFGILSALFLVLVALLISSFPQIADAPGIANVYTAEMINIVQIIYLVTGVISFLLGILSIVGGIYSLKKKMWGLALAGAIAGIFVFLPTGIAAVIYTAMGHREFVSANQVAPLIQ
jgi:hypothetical protein